MNNLWTSKSMTMKIKEISVRNKLLSSPPQKKIKIFFLAYVNQCIFCQSPSICSSLRLCMSQNHLTCRSMFCKWLSKFVNMHCIKSGFHFARKHDRNGKQNQKMYALPVFSFPAQQNYNRIQSWKCWTFPDSTDVLRVRQPIGFV